MAMDNLTAEQRSQLEITQVVFSVYAHYVRIIITLP